MSRIPYQNSIIRELNVRYWIALGTFVFFVLSFLFSKGYLAENVLVFLGTISADAADGMSHREAIRLFVAEPWYDTLIVLAWVSCAISLVAWIMFIYKLWDILPAYRARMTPIQAAFPLIIPGFNVYWVFVATVGFARDANKVLRLRAIDAKNVSLEVAFVACVTLWGSFSPIGGHFFLLAFLVCAGLFAVQARGAALVIAQTNRTQTRERQPLMRRTAPPPGAPDDAADDKQASVS